MLTYVCTHETTPQSDQHVHTSKTFHLALCKHSHSFLLIQETAHQLSVPTGQFTFSNMVSMSHTVCTNCLASSLTSITISDFIQALPCINGGFPGGSNGKESACNAGDPGSVPGLGSSLGERNGNPLQYSCLENSMDRGAWWATVHRVEKSWT